MRTSYEGARGCGYRKGGGIYLVSDGIGMNCDLLPFEMKVCPVCGQGIKPARGWTWVEPDGLLPHHQVQDEPGDGGWITVDEQNPAHLGCPLNRPGLMGEKAGLLWIGESFYPTPQDWIREGRQMGFSRRIHNLPRGFKIGETWVLTAHRKAIAWVEPKMGEEDEKVTYLPAIFHVWKPDRIEYVVKGTETPEELEALEARGLELVKVVPLDEAGKELPGD